MDQKSRELHEHILEALEHADDAPLMAVVAVAHAADLAEVFELLADEERSRIIFALPPPTAAEVVVLLDEAVRGNVVDDLTTEKMTDLVAELPPDDAADVLGELPEAESHQILEHIPDEKSEKIEELLEYDEHTAGGIMTTDVVSIRASRTIADAVEVIRGATTLEELHEIFVTDAEGRLSGTVPLRRMVTNPPGTRLVDICDDQPIYVQGHEDQEAVLLLMRKYDVPELAVVDAERNLIGRITHDDLLDVAEEEHEEDMLHMAGTDAAELETSSVFRAARIRLTWLLPCMGGMCITAGVMILAGYRIEPLLFGTLVVFVPLIGATGGNSGVQISTIVVRGLATQELAATKISRALAREGRIALVMAPVCGITSFGLVQLVLPLLRPEAMGAANVNSVGLSVGIAMMIAILAAACLGIVLPFAFKRLGVDPAIASGPLVTTANDVLSVSIYMLIAMCMINT